MNTQTTLNTSVQAYLGYPFCLLWGAAALLSFYIILMHFLLPTHSSKHHCIAEQEVKVI